MTSTFQEAVWSRALGTLDLDPLGAFNSTFEICTKWAKAEPGRRALTVVEPDGSRKIWTYGELDRLSQLCATVFADAGLRRGDRVAALLSRQVESLVVALATWGSGLVYVPLYCGLGSDAIRQRLHDSNARMVVADERWTANLEAALSAGDTTPHVITVKGPGKNLWSLMESTTPTVGLAETHGHDTATVLFTSGTTGPAKSCLMPHNGMVSLIPFVQHCLDLRGGTSRLFTTADPGWSYGLYSTGVVPMAQGVERVVFSGDFDPGVWLDIIEDQQITAIGSAPSAYRRLAGELGHRRVPPSLVTVGAAGEPLLPETASQWSDGGGPAILDAYGLTEVGIVLGDTSDPPSDTSPGSLAGPVPGFDVRLVDESGFGVPLGDPGHIAIKRPPFQLSSGYENAPEAWAERWKGDLFVTEDVALIGDDGRWRFVGRADDMIITQGFNVSPVEVETVLASLPEVAEAAVVAARQPGRGTVVRAVVVLSPGAEPGPALELRIRDAVSQRVAKFASPRIIDYVVALPRTEAGKLKRSSLSSGPGRHP